jgi:hypothetical protein
LSKLGGQAAVAELIEHATSTLRSGISLNCDEKVFFVTFFYFRQVCSGVNVIKLFFFVADDEAK